MPDPMDVIDLIDDDVRRFLAETERDPAKALAEEDFEQHRARLYDWMWAHLMTVRREREEPRADCHISPSFRQLRLVMTSAFQAHMRRCRALQRARKVEAELEQGKLRRGRRAAQSR